MEGKEKRRNLFFFFIVLAVGLPMGSHGETLHMRNGAEYDGEVIGQDRDTVQLRLQSGIIILQKKDIKRIHYVAGDRRNGTQSVDGAGTQDTERLRLQEQENRERADRDRVERTRRLAGIQDEEVLWDRMHKDADIKDAVTSPAIATVTAPPVAPVAGPGVSRSEVMWRSALLPGWGQFHQDRRIRGSAFAGGFLFAGGAMIYYARELARDTRAYQSSVQNVFNSMFVFNGPARSFSAAIPTTAAVGLSSLELYYISERNNARAAQVGSAHRLLMATSVVAGLYLWDIGDAYWGSRTRTSLGLMPSPDGGSLVLVYRF